jgi:hypothetical protein
MATRPILDRRRPFIIDRQQLCLFRLTCRIIREHERECAENMGEFIPRQPIQMSYQRINSTMRVEDR